ncbi:MAG: hypothetical protein L0338_39640 [Acidobacteria bacterium]|nr:hypothetical protein [Acidobacteriota bacterium]
MAFERYFRKGLGALRKGKQVVKQAMDPRSSERIRRDVDLEETGKGYERIQARARNGNKPQPKPKPVEEETQPMGGGALGGLLSHALKKRKRKIEESY